MHPRKSGGLSLHCFSGVPFGPGVGSCVFLDQRPGEATYGKLSEGQTIWDIIDPNGDLETDRRKLSDYERREIHRAVVKHRKKRCQKQNTLPPEGDCALSPLEDRCAFLVGL